MNADQRRFASIIKKERNARLKICMPNGSAGPVWHDENMAAAKALEKVARSFSDDPAFLKACGL